MANPPAMSMEASLDQERLEVLALLQQRSTGQPRVMGPASSMESRSTSPYVAARSPMRSMLDLDVGGPADTGSPRLQPVRSMLDVVDEPYSPMTTTAAAMAPPMGHPARMMATGLGAHPGGIQSGPTSPVIGHAALSPVGIPGQGSHHHHHPRSLSDASSRPMMDSAVRGGLPKVGGGPNPYHQFGPLLTKHAVPAAPKRVAQGGRRHAAAGQDPVGNSGAGAGSGVGGGADRGGAGGSSTNSEVAAAAAAAVAALGISDRGRQFYKSTPRPGSSSKSMSPHERQLEARSRSPLNPTRPSAGTAVLDDGTVFDLNNAYRRLSDANLAMSGGSLSQLAHRKRVGDLSGRLNKDWITEAGEYEDSTDDEVVSSDDEERGRQKEKIASPARTRDARPAQSLLGAAEEERLEVVAQQPAKYQYRSLFDEPIITITNPSGDKARQQHSKSEVRPSTSYDPALESAAASAIDSDDAADVEDIQRAQKLSFSMTPVIGRPDAHRAIRIIYRGEYDKVVEAAEKEHRRLRKYVVATDLSDESAHALEWAVGTVLRDGDTLMAIYCVDEETGIGGVADGGGGGDGPDGGQVADDPRAMREAAAAISALASPAPAPAASTLHLAWTDRRETSPAAGHMGGGGASRERERTRSEDERFRAVQAITDKVVRLLRKTRLQVRVTIEVLHCKNPKHLITEVIDLTSPTLVILGSRGRSALKGVILGSFSNYLVTKSSAPVMVARKRLRKQKKYKTKLGPQVNNISGPSARKLSNAKAD